jgi:hypothetical protein
MEFAQQLKLTIESAGWIVNGVNVGFFTGSVKGLSINITDPANVPSAAEALMRSLSASGIQVKGVANPSQAIGTVEIIVGSKD